MATEIYLPKMTDHMEGAEIVQWLATEGDTVEARQPILEVMTDKVTAEVEAPVAGVLKGIRPGLEVGTIVPVGETIAFVAEPGEEVPALPALGPAGARPAASPEPAAAAAPVQEAETPEAGRVRATPAARAAARQTGVDISLVKGTGPAGRVSEEDVRAYAARQRPAAAPAAETPSWMELDPIQRVTGERMVESTRVPQFTLSISTDATGLLAARQSLAQEAADAPGKKPSITALLVKGVAASLKKHPRLNASYDDGRLRMHPGVNVGVAVGTEQGLVVPVVRDADGKSLGQVVADLMQFREKARTLHFGADDLSGGTITISNLGMFEIDRFTAIVNPPEAAILAVGRIAKKLVILPDDSMAVRPMVEITLAVDHRVADGVQAAAFLSDLKSWIEHADRSDWSRPSL